MRLLICAGGTGGGVYPALAVHDVLTSKVKDVKTLWVGGEGGIEESLVKRHGIPFQSIPAAGVHGVSPLVLPRNLPCEGYAPQKPRVNLELTQTDLSCIAPVTHAREPGPAANQARRRYPRNQSAISSSDNSPAASARSATTNSASVQPNR